MCSNQAGRSHKFYRFGKSHVSILDKFSQTFQAGKGSMPLIAMIKISIKSDAP